MPGKQPTTVLQSAPTLEATLEEVADDGKNKNYPSQEASGPKINPEEKPQDQNREAHSQRPPPQTLPRSYGG